jgi:hypothetical protein
MTDEMWGRAKACDRIGETGWTQAPPTSAVTLASSLIQGCSSCSSSSSRLPPFLRPLRLDARAASAAAAAAPEGAAVAPASPGVRVVQSGRAMGDWL